MRLLRSPRRPRNDEKGCHCERLPRRLLAPLGVSARNDTKELLGLDPNLKPNMHHTLKCHLSEREQTYVRIKVMSMGGTGYWACGYRCQ